MNDSQVEADHGCLEYFIKHTEVLHRYAKKVFINWKKECMCLPLRKPS